jgi:hypothetical protein
VKLLFLMIVGVCFVVLTSMNAEAKTFTLDDFSFNMPSGCKSDKEQNRFQTDNVHLECGVSGGVHKEMVFESGTYDELIDMSASPEAMISEVESMQHTIYGAEYPETFESGADKYTVNNFSAPYVISTWEHVGHNLFGAELKKDIVGMAVAVKLSDNKVVLAQYIAAEDAFDKNLKKFEAAFKSIKPEAGVSNSEASITPTAEDNSQNYQQCLDNEDTTLEQCQTRYPNASAEADKNMTAEDKATRQKALDIADKLRQLGDNLGNK